MRYQPERALTRVVIALIMRNNDKVEMRYQPERALTHGHASSILALARHSRNEISAREGIDTFCLDGLTTMLVITVEMRYKPERALKRLLSVDDSTF